MRTIEQLKAEFSQAKGCDADEDSGYFVEWLVDEVNRLESLTCFRCGGTKKEWTYDPVSKENREMLCSNCQLRVF